MRGYWKTLLEEESNKEYFITLMDSLKELRKTTIVYPSNEDVFKAFEITPFENIKVVILGQDPYYLPNMAHGLSFSVPKTEKIPKSLKNIFKELEDDLDIKNNHGDLTSWAKQGVFLLNTILTVEKDKPLSHQNLGWHHFIEKVIMALGKRDEPIIFVLWGKQAQQYIPYIEKQHYVLSSSHPSPLSAYRGFLGSKPFSKINNILIKDNKKPINWRND